MINGGITNIKLNGWVETEGCDTCDYGWEYFDEMNIEMVNHRLVIEMLHTNEFESPTIEDMIMLFVNKQKNMEEMTEEEFIEFIKKGECFKADVDVKFNVYKNN